MALIEKLTNIADGFRTSRSLTEKLSLDEMAVLAAVPIQQGGDNKIGQFVDGSLTVITAADLGDITTIRNYAFYKSPITSIELPASITNYLNSSVWTDSNSLTEVKYDGTIEDWATKITAANSNAIPTGLSSVNTMWFRNNQGEYYKVEDDLIIPEGPTGINPYMFGNFTLPRNIVVPSSAKTLGRYSFYGCSNVINITLKDGIEVINQQGFSGCNIQNLVIPNSARSLQTQAFAYCNSLSEVRIGNGITTMASNAFSSCPNLTDIYIDKAEGSVSGAPWGATNATVHWNTPLPTN